MIFTHFLSDIPWLVSFYTSLEKNTTFFYNFFGFGGISPPPPAGAPGFSYTYLTTKQHWTTIGILYEKISRKEYNEMKNFSIFAFFLQLLLKNHYLNWINEESHKIQFEFFEGCGEPSHLWGLGAGLLDKSLSNIVVFYVFIGIF